MAEYQRIEYRIGPDGKIQETVMGGTGDRCITGTADLEQALGEVEQRQYLPEYHEDNDSLNVETVQQGQHS